MNPSDFVGAFVTTVARGDTDEFAELRAGPDGIGRIRALHGTLAEVEYFLSPAGPRLLTKQVDLMELKRVSLRPQTVVFWEDPVSGAWRRGRVTAADTTNVPPSKELYRVQFPNDHVESLPGSALHVRWSHPIDDPLEYVAARVTDTPYFYEGRRRIVSNLAGQRALFGGLTGLASAAIDLLPHQVAIARRVLADPAERYLLADEVGLGKTIEAGIVIRQHLLDCPRSAKVLVVVPPHLVEQWKRELETRFGIGGQDQRVAILTEDEVARQARFPAWTMMVLDEAHRSARGAFEAPGSHLERLYARLRELARSTPRLLLLSGTPVLRQEDGFLAMLHLLDPEAYPLTDRDAFRQRIAARSDVADAVAQLTESAPGFFLEQAIGRLVGAFGDDARLRDLADRVLRLADEDEISEERGEAVRALRLHVTEAYKLHRRLLRTRRDDPAIQDLLGKRGGVGLIACDDSPRALAWELVEAWRNSIPLDALGARPEHGKPLMAGLVEAALSHPLAAKEWFDQRARQVRSPAGRGQSLFAEEEAWCAAAGRRLAAALQEEPRAAALATWIQQNGGKAIVFVDRPDVASRVGDDLRERLGAAVVEEFGAAPVDGQAVEDPVETFVRRPGVRVLVANRRAEEGLNLQRVQAALIHYDLPLAPTRIEQRNGRVDRLDAKRSPRFLAFEGIGEYETAWLGLLYEVGVFSRSVAALQYALADSCERLGHAFLAEGAEAFAEEARRLRGPEGLEAELSAIRHQEALDSIGLDSTEEQDFFEALQAGDDRESEASGADCDAWLRDRLLFGRKSCGAPGVAGSALQYAYALGKPALLPLHEVVTTFGTSIDREHTTASELRLGPLTYDRLDALAFKGVQLLRPGSAFLDAVEALVRSDDRGAAFAMWRPVPGMAPDGASLHFRFDFVVEADLRAAEAAVDEAGGATEALRRAADAALPPFWRTVWIDANLKPVTDAGLIAVLERPFDRSHDKNLRLERWARADEFCPVHDWPALCAAAREAAQKALDADADFQKRRDIAVRWFKEASEARRVQSETRVGLLTNGAAREGEVQSAAQAARIDQFVLEGIRSPLVRVDAMGAVYLAGAQLVAERT